jgi:zinc protease
VRRKLDNGLVVLALERRHLPTFSATLLLPAGVVAEPEGSGGAAFFASQLLPLGTHGHSAVSLAEEIDGLGASLGSGCDYDYATIEAHGLARDAEQLLRLLSEVASQAAFAEEEVERRRSQILALLRRRKDDTNDLVRNRFFELIYGPHPYRRSREGTEESVTNLSREDLLRFYRSHYGPDRTILAMVGDFDAEEAVGWAHAHLSGWAAANPPEDVLPAIPIAADRQVATIQHEATQATIRMGNLGFQRNHPDFPASVVMNYILGGAGFGSRLMVNLREEKGLTYGVSSNLWVRKHPGYFFVGTQTRLETMNEAIAEILLEIERFLETGATKEELAWAKRYLGGSLPLTLETNDQLAQKLLEQEFYGLPEEFWLADLDAMLAVDVERVNEVARRTIHPERFAIVVLSDFRGHSLTLPED